VAAPAAILRSMEDRYSLSDRQIYGAEDDADMDSILNAIDRQLNRAENAPAAKSKSAPSPKAKLTPQQSPAPKASSCVKNAFRTQAEARTGLNRWQEADPTDNKVPHRVYPCDRCDGWHLTRKRSGKRKPAWDKNPDWTRSPAQLAKLEKRFEGPDSR